MPRGCDSGGSRRSGADIGVATVEHTRPVFEAAAKMAAKLRDGVGGTRCRPRPPAAAGPGSVDAADPHPAARTPRGSL